MSKTTVEPRAEMSLIITVFIKQMKKKMSEVYLQYIYIYIESSKTSRLFEPALLGEALRTDMHIGASMEMY